MTHKSHAAPVRVEVRYSGDVQGVGFRYTTSTIARGTAVGGYVQNLPNGDVRLVVEGAAADVEALLASVRDRMDGHIASETRKNAAATGEFDAFMIRT